LGNTIDDTTENGAKNITTISLWYSETNTVGIPFVEDNYYIVNR